jgi:hypothetical protein
VFTFTLIVAATSLGVSTGILVHLLLLKTKEANSLRSEVEVRQRESESQIYAVSEELTKCKNAYTSLRSKAEFELKRLQAETSRMSSTIADQNAKMQRWRVIIDAEAEADRIRSQVSKEVQELKDKAEAIVSDASARASRIRREAEIESQYSRQQAVQARNAAQLESDERRKAARKESDLILALARRESDELKREASAIIEGAQVKSSEILAEAHRSAREIAGEAYEVKLDIGKYEKLLRAIKNELQGYGDEYIVPSHSVLDEIADEFSFVEAGQRLKDARNLVRSMVKDGVAASCDYVETNRRETAIRFVVDAFNGKVDSILALVKHDNFGKLNQQIKDAFTLVNGNGEAFRNARITEEYLNARLDELKWAVLVNELKKRDLEEQRLIKERIREEQKAKREYERALRDAKKEEDAVQKAMMRLTEQLSRASAEEREKYQTELQSLQERLRVAEEKGQRAISMAQQTRCGYVYIISNVGSFGDDVFKIGLTRRLEPLDRVRELGDSSVPFEFDVHAMIRADDAPALEHQLHRHFVLHQVNKVNHRKEFFRCDLATIRKEVEDLGLQSQWTMRAEAREYRETLAIEKKISSDPLAKEQWLQRQLELEVSENEDEILVTGVGSDDDGDTDGL